MNLTQQDFANTSAYYQDKYNKILQLYDIVIQLEDREYTRAEKAKKDAQINWDIVTTAMNESGIAWGDLTEDQQLKLGQIEVQAGLPIGFSEKILASVNPDKTIMGKLTTKSQISILYDDGTIEVFNMGLEPELEKPTTKELKESERISIESDLKASRGTDTDVCPGGCADPRVYQRLRSQADIGPTDFDNRFSYLLSPQERINLGIDKARTDWQFGTAAEQSEVMQWLSQESEVTDEDYERAKIDRDFFYYALSQVY